MAVQATEISVSLRDGYANTAVMDDERKNR